jgi:hypothetical protein
MKCTILAYTPTITKHMKLFPQGCYGDPNTGPSNWSCKAYRGESPMSVRKIKRYVNQQAAVRSLSMWPVP